MENNNPYTLWYYKKEQNRKDMELVSEDFESVQNLVDFVTRNELTWSDVFIIDEPKIDQKNTNIKGEMTT